MSVEAIKILNIFVLLYLIVNGRIFDVAERTLLQSLREGVEN
jgi:hypothetical protein